MTSSSSPPIPSFYHIFFSSIDPLIALSAIYFNFFDPETSLGSMFPPSDPSFVITPLHTLILHQLGGAFFTIIFLQVVLLRYTKDVQIWKIFQTSILLMDFAMFFSIWMALKSQNRCQVGRIRWEEWGNIGITGFVTITRIAFLAEVGFKKSRNQAKKRA
ncbi:hypothetical protein B0J11DRAFT_518141 [Dendryphion nanum]|uniref:DUF7704 domain-containing protein n=1 Tax=Dendryphion nanum TaxID=256645 RepID=A0A9P9EDU6_9PLEO|nr:hypothetical protein B0J11DRAFT_518141 [Dendryphion nanum]